jgi:hypothetical protein
MKTLVILIQKSQIKMLLTHSRSNQGLIMLKIISVMKNLRKKMNKRILQTKIKKKEMKRRKEKKIPMQ